MIYQLDLNRLIKGCIRRKPEARQELYYRYRDSLFLTSLKYCSSYEEAEDHLHDMFILIFEKIKSYKGKGSFEGWMKRIVINKAIDKYKNRKDVELAEYKLAGISEEVMLEEESQSISIEILIQLIQKLPNQYRLVFSMYQLDGYSHKEIGKKLSISESTSKSNLHRAKIHLKEHIQKHISPRTTKSIACGN